jgi:hypothetical protein
MTLAQARAFLAENAGRDLCLAYVPRPDGTISLRAERPSIVPVARLRRPLAAAGLGAALAACTPHGATGLELEVDDPTPPVAAAVVIPDHAAPAGPPPPPVLPAADPELDLDRSPVRGSVRLPIKGRMRAAAGD